VAVAVPGAVPVPKWDFSRTIRRIAPASAFVDGLLGRPYDGSQAALCGTLADSS